jgi:hypothetical protein
LIYVGRVHSSSRVLALTVCVFLLAAAPAVARDSHAPDGARDRWLPCESWVMYHWIPFDQKRLWAITGIKKHEFRHWIADDDNHSLGMLIERHGHDPDEVTAQLMEQWRGKVSLQKLAELTRRTNALMTQGHLSQHVFFHYFHDPLLAMNSKWIFNIPPGDYHRARLRGYSPAEIAIRGGVSVRKAVRRTMTVLRRNQNEAIKNDQTSPAQARSFLKQQRKWTNFWLTQKLYAHRKDSFPAGHAAAKGNRLRQACTYMAGASHPAGEHDDLVKAKAAAEPGENRRPELGSLHCNLIRTNARPEVDPKEVAALRDYLRVRWTRVNR